MTRHPAAAALAALTLLAAAVLWLDLVPAGPVALAVCAAWGLGAMMRRRS